MESRTPTADALIEAVKGGLSATEAVAEALAAKGPRAIRFGLSKERLPQRPIAQARQP